MEAAVAMVVIAAWVWDSGWSEKKKGRRSSGDKWWEKRREKRREVERGEGCDLEGAGRLAAWHEDRRNVG